MIRSKTFRFYPYIISLTYLTIRVREKLASGTMAVAGDQWPLLVYDEQEYDEDNPWHGLFRSRILLYVCFSIRFLFLSSLTCGSQAFKHIFTSPSSVENDCKATRSGNARIHGMTRVTKASIAYTATQVRVQLPLKAFNLSRS